MSPQARSAALLVSVWLGVVLGFARGRPHRDNLAGTWALEMRAMRSDTDAVTHRGTIVLVTYRQDGATWSFNIRRPDYVGAYDFQAPLPTYAPSPPSQFPAVAAKWLSSDSVMVALGPQNVDHGWLNLIGPIKGDSICGSWALTAYAIAHHGSYCMRRANH